MKGIVFNIQKFSIHDGPGIRTTVFLKGCPLRCQWCANPESQLASIQILHDSDQCIHCHHCADICPTKAIRFDPDFHFDLNKCNGCLKCVNECPTRALSNEGEYKSVEEVVAECLQDKDFYEESGGGVTISGGEGFFQPDYLEALIKALKKEHIHIAIETTGYVPHDLFKRLAPAFDLLLFDVKHVIDEKHKKGTGVDHQLIDQNFTFAINHQINVLPRIPVIPDFNDSLEDAKDIALYLKSRNALKVQLLPFHQMGEKKYQMLNRHYSYASYKPYHNEDLTAYQQVFLDHGIHAFF